MKSGYIRIPTYAAIMGISRQAVHYQINSGKLIAVEIDGIKFILAPENNKPNNQTVKTKGKK